VVVLGAVPVTGELPAAVLCGVAEPVPQPATAASSSATVTDCPQDLRARRGLIEMLWRARG
jgi:hypothetical protein